MEDTFAKVYGKTQKA